MTGKTNTVEIANTINVKHNILMNRLNAEIDRLNKSEHPEHPISKEITSGLADFETRSGTHKCYEVEQDGAACLAIAAFNDLETGYYLMEALNERDKEIAALRKALEYFWNNAYDRYGQRDVFHDGSIDDYVDWFKKKGLKKAVDEQKQLGVVSATDYENMILGGQ